MIKFTQKGDFKKTDTFLKKILKLDYKSILSRYGQKGVETLRQNTPVDSGLTANSWDYKIVEKAGSVSIYWTNSNIQDGVPIAVIIQYGHGTGTGGYVQGIDYINPALRPIFDEIAESLWKEVTGS